MANGWLTLKNVKKEKLDTLLDKGFKDTDTKSPYETRRMRSDDALIIQYTSGKTVLQGKEEYIGFLSGHLGSKVKSSPGISEIKEKGTIIGSDEVLKGDTFGGLIVVAVKADERQRDILRKIGVKDSKKIPDSSIHGLAEDIKNALGKTNYSIYELYPERYNELTTDRKMSTTGLLNMMHTRTLGKLGQSDRVIVDQYPGCRIGIQKAESMTRAESKFIEVAAASIIARSEALIQLGNLSRDAGILLPKGSTHVKESLEILTDGGKDLRRFAKLHFRNVKAYL